MLFWPYGCINGRYGFALALRSISGAYAFALTGRCYGDGRHNPGCRSLLRSFACPGLCAFAPSGRFVVADCAMGDSPALRLFLRAMRMRKADGELFGEPEITLLSDKIG